jgi:hypothetical protein
MDPSFSASRLSLALVKDMTASRWTNGFLVVVFAVEAALPAFKVGG